MGLLRYLQKEKEINELKRLNEIEAAKLREQRGKEKLKYCPHCGKPLP